ncbi:MAG: ABC transporter permease [Syntrophobacteraceae bacterium]|nr:ABC transporter permease [Syntrophobacteraceae bacterium]
MGFEQPGTIVYTPDSALRRPIQLLRSLARDLGKSRELATTLLMRNLKAQYRQTILGCLWAFLPPVVTTITFVFLHSQDIIRAGETQIPYPAYVLLGTLLWQGFTDAINSPLRLVNASASMLANVNFPREAILLAGFGEVLFYFSIRLVLFAAVLVFYAIPVPSTIVAAPLGILSLMAFGWVLGLFLIPLGILYKDIEMGIGIFTTLWFFVTPVVYAPAKAGLVDSIVALNPVTPLIVTTRELMTTGAPTCLSQFLLVSLGTVFFLLAGWVMFRLAMPHLVKVMQD